MNRGDRGNGRAMAGRAMAGTHARTATRGGDDSSAESLRKLEALFSGGGGAPPVARQGGGGEPRVFASPRKSLGRTPSDLYLRRERLRIAREPEEICAAADEFLKYHAVPDDLELLLKLLQHTSEAVLVAAMGEISSLLSQHRVKTTMLLADRLDDLEGRVREPTTRDYIAGLRGQMAALAGK